MFENLSSNIFQINFYFMEKLLKYDNYYFYIKISHWIICINSKLINSNNSFMWERFFIFWYNLRGIFDVNLKKKSYFLFSITLKWFLCFLIYIAHISISSFENGSRTYRILYNLNGIQNRLNNFSIKKKNLLGFLY